MTDKERTHQRLAALAKQQHGVVTTRQLAELGYARESASYASRSGRLHRLHRGVYAVGHTSVTWEGRCLAAVLSCGPSAVVSHTSAAWLWGLLRTRPGIIHVTAPTRRHRKAGLRLHFARLADEDRSVCDGVPLTAVPRVLLDLAATLNATRLDQVIERSEELRLFDLRAVEHSSVGRVATPAAADCARRLPSTAKTSPSPAPGWSVVFSIMCGRRDCPCPR